MTVIMPPEVTLKTAQTTYDRASELIGEKNTPEPGEHEKLPEEVKFDKRVYGGISYFAQAATGVLLTNWLQHGGGRRHFVKIAEWLGPNLMTLVSRKKGAEAIEEATSTIIVSTMIMVGNAFLLPVKWLENRKPKIVRNMVDRANERREAAGEVIPAEELERQQKSLNELDKAPKQTWWSLLGGRGFGLAAVYATMWGITNPNNVRMSEATFKIAKGLTDAVGLKKVARSKTLENYSRIAFYDMFYSSVSAGGLYVYSHFIMPPKRKRLNGVAEEEPVLPPLEEAIIEEVEPRKQPKHKLESAPKHVMLLDRPSGEGWKKNLQQMPVQARMQQAATHVDGVTQSDSPPAEMTI